MIKRQARNLLVVRSETRRRALSAALICASFWLSGPAAHAADMTAVKSAIAKGVANLAPSANATGPSAKLAVLAMYKGGHPKTAPEIAKLIKDVQDRCAGGKYKPAHEHIYEAGVEATLLADVDPEKYREELILIRDYLLETQHENGSWNYPKGRETGYFGDMSVTQYGCLGLWACARAGIPVEPTVWEKILQWHVKYQNPDGGYAYCPGVVIGQFGKESSLNMSVNAVGNMHIAMLQLSPGFIPLKDNKPAPKPAEGPTGPKFGVLETVNIDGGEDDPKNKKTPSISEASIGALRRAFGYVTPRYRNENAGSYHFAYYYYSLERMAALANVDSIAGKNWFDECSDYLIKSQKPDGSWKMSKDLDATVDTAFAVLFLTRSTGRLLNRVSEPGYGDGTLAGGRGLPDDLENVDFNGRSVNAKEMPVEPLDKLLASLQNTGDVNLDNVQDQIVEQIQLGDRSALIEQLELLLKLVKHPDANVRQTAIWALGRTDNLSLARHLVAALNDPELSVIIEAQRSLCWLSRRPTGFGLAEDPLDDLPPDASAQQKADAIASWHQKLILSWGPWYLSVRPFADRGDEFEARLRQQIEQYRRAANARR